MKKLKDFEKEINKCSKCGLCQNVCPIYQLTGNECVVSKGKFVILSGVLKGDLKLSSKINSYLDLCLKCGKCSNFCPAGIDACEILQTAKYEYLSQNRFNNFLSTDLLDKILNFAEKLSAPLRQSSQGTREILYFKGCVNKIFPSTENALKTILNKFNIRLVDLPFSCCGLPFYSQGDMENFELAKAKNTQLINESPCEYVLTDCASCENILKKYGTINKKIVNAETLIAELEPKFKFKKHYKIAFHKPCHLENADFLPKILQNCSDVEFVEIPDSCCGFSGEFAVKKPKLSAQLGEKRAKEILDSGAEIVLTSCPACVIGLKKALLGTKVKVYNIIDFLQKGL